MRGPSLNILLVLALLGALCAVTIAFNAHVDPYGLRGQVDDTSNPRQVRTGGFYRKVFHAREAGARTVILGTSRAQLGLDPHHPGIASADRTAFNLALGAASIEQIRLLLAHAHTSSPLRQAIIGLDFESFLGPGRSDFDPSLLAGNPESQPVELSWLRLNVSLEVTRASVRKQWGLGGDPEVERGEAPPDRDARLDAQRGTVWMTEFRNFYMRLTRLFPSASQEASWYRDARSREAMASFAALLRYARQENIELRLFISPVHARFLDWYRRVGWWPHFEAWKQALALEIEREAREHHGRPPFVLWDLSSFGGPSAEPVPRLDDLSTRMHWYYESSHYSVALGARILDTVLGIAPPAEDWPVTRIDAANVDAHLRLLRDDAERWREAHPSEATNVAAMVSFLRKLSRR